MSDKPKVLVNKIIRHEDNQYCVYTHDGDKKLGCHKTKKEALAQLAAIESYKKNKDDKKEWEYKNHDALTAVAMHLELAMASETLEEAKGHVEEAWAALNVASESYASNESESEDVQYGKSELVVTKNEDGSTSWAVDFKFSKLDDEQRLVGGLVYEPDEKDTQGDYADARDIEKAAHNFMLESQIMGLMHKEDVSEKVKIVETYIAPQNIRVGNQMFKRGSWVIVVKVLDDELWKEIKSGKISGFSMGGRAVNADGEKQ